MGNWELRGAWDALVAAIGFLFPWMMDWNRLLLDNRFSLGRFRLVFGKRRRSERHTGSDNNDSGGGKRGDEVFLFPFLTLVGSPFFFLLFLLMIPYLLR